MTSLKRAIDLRYTYLTLKPKIIIIKTPPQNHIAFIMPSFKGIGSRHKSGTGNNQGRQQTTPRDNR